MNGSNSTSFILAIKLFDCLLEQFSGSEGELPLAITYLAQAATLEDNVYKGTLIRIARAKIRHADIFGSILLQIARNQIGPLSIASDSGEVENFLISNGFHNFQYQRAIYSLSKALGHEPLSARSHSARIYFTANIDAEEKQMIVYKRLVELTNVPVHASALNYAKCRQEGHRNELVELLKRFDC